MSKLIFEAATRQALSEGLPYADTRGNATVNYPGAQEIFSPFFEAVAAYGQVQETRIEVAREPEVLLGQDEQQLRAYKRGLVELILPEEFHHNFNPNEQYRTSVTLMYAFDTKRPIIKAFTGFERRSCLNLCVFKPHDIFETDLFSDNWRVVYEQITQMIDGHGQRVQTLRSAYDTMLREVSGNDLNELIGRIARKAAGETGQISRVNQMLQLIDSPSDYNGVRNEYYNADGVHTGYNLFQAMIATKAEDVKLKTVNRPEQLLTAYEFFSAN